MNVVIPNYYLSFRVGNGNQLKSQLKDYKEIINQFILNNILILRF